MAGLSGGPENAGLRQSLSAGIVNGGMVRSLIATRARGEIGIRLPPGITAGEVEAAIAGLAPDSHAGITRAKSWEASWTALDDPLVADMLAAATSVRGRAP